MTTVSVTQINPSDSITSSGANLPHNEIAAVVNGNLDDTNIASLSGTKITAGTLPASASATAANVETRFTDNLFDYVASGCVWSGDAYASTRNASMTAGVAYIGGKRLVIAAITARSFTASKDTYIDLDTSGSTTYTEVTNNAASPALTSGYIRIGIIVTGASNIAAVGSVNQGQEDKVLPIASSVPYTVTDSLGNLICPRDPNRRTLGYRQRTSDFTSTGSNTQITELSAPVIVPAGRKVKITVYAKNWRHTVAVTNITLSVWDGIAGSGTEVGRSFVTVPGASYSLPCGLQTEFTPSAASKTYNAAFSGSASTGTMEGGATYPMFIRVELV